MKTVFNTTERGYLTFKVILRSLATGCVILGWGIKTSGGGVPVPGDLFFWSGIAVTVFSFFL